MAALKAARQSLRLPRGFESLPRRSRVVQYPAAGSITPSSGSPAPKRATFCSTRRTSAASSCARGFAVCGVMRTRGSLQSGCPSGSGSGSVTSRSGAPSAPSRSAATRAAVSTSCAAAHVHEHAAGAQQRELARADDALRLGRQRRAQHDVVAVGEQLGRVPPARACARRPAPRRPERVERDHVHAERLQAAGSSRGRSRLRRRCRRRSRSAARPRARLPGHVTERAHSGKRRGADARSSATMCSATVAAYAPAADVQTRAGVDEALLEEGLDACRGHLHPLDRLAQAARGRPAPRAAGRVPEAIQDERVGSDRAPAISPPPATSRPPRARAGARQQPDPGLPVIGSTHAASA